jgi:hypothetical protein
MLFLLHSTFCLHDSPANARRNAASKALIVFSSSSADARALSTVAICLPNTAAIRHGSGRGRKLYDGLWHGGQAGKAIEFDKLNRTRSSQTGF